MHGVGNDTQQQRIQEELERQQREQDDEIYSRRHQGLRRTASSDSISAESNDSAATAPLARARSLPASEMQASSDEDISRIAGARSLGTLPNLTGSGGVSTKSQNLDEKLNETIGEMARNFAPLINAMEGDLTKPADSADHQQALATKESLGTLFDLEKKIKINGKDRTALETINLRADPNIDSDVQKAAQEALSKDVNNGGFVHVFDPNKPTEKAEALKEIAIKARDDFQTRLKEIDPKNAREKKELEQGLEEINKAIDSLDNVINNINKAVETNKADSDKIKNNDELTDAEKQKQQAELATRLQKIVTGFLTEAMQAMAAVANAYSRLAGDAHKNITSGIAS